MNLEALDIVVLAVYFVGMTLMGVYFSRKNKNTEEYFVGGRSFPGWVIGLSLVGTSISSVTFLAYPADAFKTAWLRFIPNFMLPVGVLIAAYVFLPFFRRGNITSAYEYLESRFGPSVRVYGAVTFIIGQLVRVAIILYLVSLVLYEMTGLSPTICILIGGSVVALYTILGGIDAVIWTDVIQTFVLVIGGLLCLAFIIIQLPGGLSQIFSVAASDGKFAFAELVEGNLKPVSWGFSIHNKTGMMMLLIGLSAWLTEYSGNQNTVQRYCASKSTYEARKAMWVCVCSSIPIWAFYMFLGTSLYVFFKVYPAVETTEILAGTRKAEQVLPFFIVNCLPQGITGLVIAAALAAAMSSLDSSINAIATISIVDIYKRHLVKNRNDQHYLKMAWFFAGVAALIMIGGAIALVNVQTKTLQDTATVMMSLVTGGILGMYLLGFLTNVGNAVSVWTGIVCTFLFTVWTILSGRGLLPGCLNIPFDLYYTGLIGNVVMFLIGFVVGTVLPQGKKDLTHLTIWK